VLYLSALITVAVTLNLQSLVLLMFVWWKNACLNTEGTKKKCWTLDWWSSNWSVFWFQSSVQSSTSFSSYRWLRALLCLESQGLVVRTKRYSGP
jgi:hypothetical protein